MIDRAPRRTLWLFGALVVYVAAQFIWWTVLLLQRDEEIRRLGLEVHALSSAPHLETDPTRKRFMVLGEAGVFLALLLALLVFVLRSVRRDLRLATVQHNFLLAVTHELRTPIAAIKLQLRTLARPELDAEQRDALRSAAVEEADRLALLTEKVLQATSTRGKAVDLQLEEMDVIPVLRGVVERAKHHVAREHKISLGGPESLSVLSEANALRSIAENLIENAAKYAPKGTRIMVTVVRTETDWRLIVADEGPGVALEERERIFERFHRSGSEETRGTIGTGLGLYIVRRLVERLGGTVGVRNQKTHGAIFTTSFPHP